MASTIEDKRAPVPAPPPVSGGSNLDVAPPRRTRTPELLIGLVLVVGFAAAAVWWVSTSTASEAVLALRVPVERGQVVNIEDLMVVHVATDDQVTKLAATASDQVVGRSAATGLEAGTLVTPSQFVAGGIVEPGRGVVGLALDAGQVPSRQLAPGDNVRIVLTGVGEGPEAAAQRVAVNAAEVLEVAGVGAQDQQVYVSLGMSESEAEIVSVAIAEDRVRLVQVARQGAG